MTSVSLFQFSLCFKSPRTPQKCGVFVCPFFWLFGCLILPQIAHASKTVELQANLESKLSAVEQIKARFGKYSIESPMHTHKHGGIKFDHIGFAKDAELGKCFYPFHFVGTSMAIVTRYGPKVKKGKGLK
jgi:hypothetical protein